MPTANQKPGELDLLFAIGLEPVRAVDYFTSKGYAISWDWWDTWQGGHSTAFTVAKATQMDVLEDIRKQVEKAIRTGQSFEGFQKELTPKLMRKGWWGVDVGVNLQGQLAVGQLGSLNRLRTIYRTNMGVAYSAGRYRDQMEIADARPYWQYIAINDAQTRPSHLQLNGFVFRYDDPFWDTHYPPCDWGCRCRVRNLTPEQVAKKGLEVKDSAGMLKDEQVEIARGVMKTVTRFKGYGANMAPGPGWNYNPGREGYGPTLAKYQPAVAKEFRTAKSGYGFAKAFPVRKIEDIEPVIKAFHTENPGVFQRGFTGIEIVQESAEFMGTDSKGKIFLLDKTLPAFDNWNPAQDLRKAMTKIGKGQDLTFNEEYSIEGLWHEISHNRAKGAGEIPEYGSARNLMETVNQFQARHTYPLFLESLGGAEAHGEAILLTGYGYKTHVENFRTLLLILEIDEIKALNALSLISFESKWSSIPWDLAKALATLYGDEAAQNKFMSALHLVPQEDSGHLDARIKRIFGMPND